MILTFSPFGLDNVYCSIQVPSGNCPYGSFTILIFFSSAAGLEGTGLVSTGFSPEGFFSEGLASIAFLSEVSLSAVLVSAGRTAGFFASTDFWPLALPCGDAGWSEQPPATVRVATTRKPRLRDRNHFIANLLASEFSR